jgi:hypothetical protein
MFNKEYRNDMVRKGRREYMRCFVMISFLLLQAKEAVTVSKRHASLKYGKVRCDTVQYELCHARSMYCGREPARSPHLIM